MTLSRSVVPTEAERSEAQWRDLFSATCGSIARKEVPPLRFAPVGTTVIQLQATPLETRSRRQLQSLRLFSFWSNRKNLRRLPAFCWSFRVEIMSGTEWRASAEALLGNGPTRCADFPGSRGQSIAHNRSAQRRGRKLLMFGFPTRSSVMSQESFVAFHRADRSG